MFVFEKLKQSDHRLQALAITVFVGLLLLLGRLWHLQVISAKTYRDFLENQTFRTVRIPAVRGEILDRNRIPLADNRPTYNLNLYLEELQPQFYFHYTNSIKPDFTNQHPNVHLTRKQISELERQARYSAVSNLLFTVSQSLDHPKLLIEKRFHQHYDQKRSLPLTLLEDISFEEAARLLEPGSLDPSVDIEVEPIRVYPHGTTASHLIGHLRRERQQDESEEFNYRFWVPGYEGVKGIELAFDQELRGKPGVKTVLVNSKQYWESEELLEPPVSGKNVVLTIDVEIQQAAEEALRNNGADTRGAIVVMHCETGDIIALASAPSFDPNKFVQGFTLEEWANARMNDPEIKPMVNRAAYGEYLPGSVFKIVVGLASLKDGLDPEENFYSTGRFHLNARSSWGDTAGVGNFNFRTAFAFSSNPYFQRKGLQVGPRKIIAMARQLGLGSPTGLTRGQEAGGYLPDDKDLKKSDGGQWMDGDTANLSIGQGDITVTPVQMAVLTAAVANGGKVLKPRLVISVESQNTDETESPVLFPSSVVTHRLDVYPEQLAIVRAAMLADVHYYDKRRGRWGTGHSAYIPNYQVCGKTGTAQKYVKSTKHLITWFVSFAPYENPKYAVVAVVEGGNGGGTTCAPMARAVYQAILKTEHKRAG
jgi:penicillin-binding protein 2